MKYFACGDIHGRLDLLESLVAHIFPKMSSDDKFVFLGDYIDRGPNSFEVLERLIELSERKSVVCIKGNHEDMLLQEFQSKKHARPRSWFWCEKAYKSYLKEAKDEDGFRCLVEKHIKWINRLPTFYQTANYFFVHAGVDPNHPLHDQIESDLIWIRYQFLLWDGPFEKHIVHGHTPARSHDVEVMHNRTNLDILAHKNGKLAVGVFEAAKREASEIFYIGVDGIEKHLYKDENNQWSLT